MTEPKASQRRWEALGDLARLATPGPWFVERGGEIDRPFFLIDAVLRDRYGDNPISSSDEPTIRFIAAASPDVVLALIAELGAVRLQVEAVERLCVTVENRMMATAKPSEIRDALTAAVVPTTETSE